MSLRIPVLLGSIRDGRFSHKAAAYVVSLLEKRGITSEVFDPKNAEINRKEIETSGWNELIEKSDALIIVSPEYNHGYPGPLKDVIDSMDEELSTRKPVAICGCSSGGLGGARVVEQLRQVMIELGMPPIRETVYFSRHKELWNEDGSIKDPTYEARVNKMVDELEWYAKTLKNGRENDK